MKLKRTMLPTERPGVTIEVTRHRTPLAAKRSMNAVQRRLYNARVWSLPGGGFDIFPAGHPVPAGAGRVDEESR